MTALEQLIQEIKTVAKLQGVTAVLHWDQETNMPAGGGEARADQIALLESLAHEKLIGESISKPLGNLVDMGSGEPDPNLDAEEQRLVREIWKDYHRASALPTKFVEELAKTTSRAQQVWADARRKKRFEDFAPILEKLVALKFKEIGYRGQKDTPYDTLLDEFEPGMTSAIISTLFEEMKARLVPLVQKISKSSVDTGQSILFKNYNEQKQWDFGLTVLKDMGYDFNHGRQDRSTHPFTIEFHPTDVRITTRINKYNLVSGFSSTVHEGGHGLYEQGLDQAWYGTPFAQAISYGIHESQSRLWENLVALSMPFWKHYYPKLQKVFPEHLDAISLDTFYRAINTVKPSFIRVEADEVTYNLHIMLRFEVEKLVINDRLPVAELPEIWNRKMEEYLNIRPEDDAQGVLQDVHWSFGGFGYFPTYALGNLYNVPIFNQAKKDIANLDELIASGNLHKLREWLRLNVHAVGRRKTAAELIQDISGQPLSAQPFMDYLEEKYNEIYSL